LYNEYNFVGAFAVAALLASLSLVTLLVKKGVELSVALKERRMAKSIPAARASLPPHSRRHGAPLSARPNESRA
jgi:hypothetical protein